MQESDSGIELAGVVASSSSIGVSSARFRGCPCRSEEAGAVSQPCDICNRTPGAYFSVPVSTDFGDYVVLDVYQRDEELPRVAMCLAELEYSERRVLRRGIPQKINEFVEKKLSLLSDCQLVPLGTLQDSEKVYFHDGFGQIADKPQLSLIMSGGGKKVFGLTRSSQDCDANELVFEGLLIAEFEWLKAQEVPHVSEVSEELYWKRSGVPWPDEDGGFENLAEENAHIQRNRAAAAGIAPQRKSYFWSKAASFALTGAVQQDRKCKRIYEDYSAQITVREASLLLAELAIEGDKYLGGPAADWLCDGCGGDLLDVPGALCSQCIASGKESSRFQNFLEKTNPEGISSVPEGFLYVNNPYVGFFNNNPLENCVRRHGYAKSWREFCPACKQSGHFFPVGMRQGPGILYSLHSSDLNLPIGFLSLVEPQDQIRESISAILESGRQPSDVGEIVLDLPQIQLARFPDFQSSGLAMAGVDTVNFADFGKPFFPIDLKPENHQVYGLFVSESEARDHFLGEPGEGEEDLKRMSFFWDGQGIFDKPQVQIGYLVINQKYESLIENPRRFIDTRALELQRLLAGEYQGVMDSDRDTWKPNALMSLADYNQAQTEQSALIAKSWLLSAGLYALAEFHFPGLPSTKLNFFKGEDGR